MRSPKLNHTQPKYFLATKYSANKTFLHLGKMRAVEYNNEN